MAVVVDAATGWLFAVETLRDGGGLAEVADAIVKVVRAGASEQAPAFHHALRVDDPKLAAALRGHLGPGVVVRVGSTPEIDNVIRAMGQRLGLGDAGLSYLENGRVKPETVGRFFEAAAALYRLAPWRVVHSDNQILRLDAPAFGVEAVCLSIIGSLGQSYGVLLFESINDFTELASASMEGAARGEGPGVPLLSINFEARKDLPPGLAREVKHHGWSVAGPRAYPLILSLAADRLVRPLAERDYEFITCLLEGLAVFLRAYPGVFEEEPESPITNTVDFDRLAGSPSVTLTAPHPDVDWDWIEGSPLDADYWDEADGLAGQFVAYHLRRGQSAEWLRGAQAVLDDLFAYKIDHLGESPIDWTGTQIDDYLLEYFPAMGSIPSEGVADMPAYLDEFFAWLGEAGHDKLAATRKIRRRIKRRRQAFLTRASGPAAAGSFRSLAQEIRKRGIKPADPAALVAAIEEWRTHIEEQAPPPARSRKRWQWTPGTPPPAPAAPCPCGSGLRYRKCCMSR